MRTGGGTFEKLALLESKVITELSGRKTSLMMRKKTLKDELCAELFSIIPSLKPGSQKALLNFKRDIFNERNIQGRKINDENGISDGFKMKFNELLELIEIENGIFHEAVWAMNEEMPALRETFKKLADDSHFKKGMLLSSRNLLERLHKYKLSDVRKLSKDDLRTEQSIIKYISRYTAKTSPFSTFTSLGIIKTINENTRQQLKPESTNILKSNIRLNNALYVYLRNVIVMNKNLNRLIPLKHNPTLKVINSQYHFLMNSYNIESFQKMPQNDAIELILYLVKEKGKININKLISIIIENQYIDAQSEEIGNYLYELINYGILEYDFGISGISPYWAEQLINFLKDNFSGNDLTSELISSLMIIQNNAAAYAESDFENREKILKNTFDLYFDIYSKLHKEAGLPEEELTAASNLNKAGFRKEKTVENEKNETKDGNGEMGSEDIKFKQLFNTKFFLKQENMFYEDVSIENMIRRDDSSFTEIASAIEDLITELGLFDGQFREIKRMKDFFLTNYGINGIAEIQDFYEEYYRQIKKPEMEKNQKDELKNEDRFSGYEDITENNRKIELFKERVSKQISIDAEKNNGTVYITKSILQKANDGLSGSRVKVRSSYAAFLQVYRTPNGGSAAVINSLTTGFGKMIGRFLHLFDESVTREFYKWNTDTEKNAMLAECRDASIFNANIHPPLVQFEICMPGSENLPDPDTKISVNDIHLKYNSRSCELELINKTDGKQVLIFDLCFQGISSRSNFYQLLCSFTTCRYYFYAILIEEANKAASRQIEDGIIVNPRVFFEENIVLQRKNWIVNSQKLPLRRKGQSFPEYMFELNLWKDSLSMPDDVFVFFSSRSQMAPEKEDKSQKVKKFSRDDYKPQYINFKNPFLVNLFEKNSEKVSTFLRIEEMLPGPGDLEMFNGKKYVKEYLVHWYDEHTDSTQQI